MIILRSRTEIEKVRAACLIVAEILNRLIEHVKPGITTWELNAISEELAIKEARETCVQGLPWVSVCPLHFGE